MKRLSNKNQKKYDLYKKIKTFPPFPRRDVCWICGQRACEEHHILGRLGKNLFLIFNRIPVCRICHMQLEAGKDIPYHKMSLIMKKNFHNWESWMFNQTGKIAHKIQNILKGDHGQ